MRNFAKNVLGNLMRFMYGTMTMVAAVAASAMDASLNDYGVSTNAVVATPVGYEKRVTLDTGETIRMYPDRLSPEEDTKCLAVLFCILSPDSLRGKYFLFNNICPCYFCRPSSPLTECFKIGRHYSFDSYDTITNVTQIAFELGQPGGPFTMEHNWGDRLYCSTSETDQRLQELDAEAHDIPRQIQELQGELSKLPKTEQLTGESRRKERRKLLFSRSRLERRIYDLQERLTNGIPRSVRYVKEARDRLLAHGGAVTNRVEPGRLCWNEGIRKMATCKLPELTYCNATLDEILHGIERSAISNCVFQCRFNRTSIRIRGSVPEDVQWTRKYDIVLPEGTILEMLLKVGSLPDVSLNVTRRYDWRWMTYSVPGNSPYVDWSKSVFSRVCPKMELKDVTASEAMEALFEIRKRYEGCWSLRIRSASLKKGAKRSFSFTGKTLREAIAELEQAFGAVYDYESGDFFDPKAVPVLEDVVKLQTCDKSVCCQDRAIRNETVLDVQQVKMLNEMMERCDVKSMDDVCCAYFLQDGDPVYTIRRRIKTLGILTDDTRKEALGFDLGSGYGNSRDVDSRQRHFVRMLRREEDRRKLYSLLFAY